MVKQEVLLSPLPRIMNLVIEAATSEMKTGKTIAKSSHSTRPKVVVNRFPENQDVFRDLNWYPVNFPIVVLLNLQC